MKAGSWCALFSFACLLLSACGGSDGPPRKETVPVSGEVVVDGKPVAGVQVRLHPVSSTDEGPVSFSAATSDEQGKFAFTTYEQDDGVPAGEYVMTFYWGDYNPLTHEYGPDRLRNRYSTPERSTFNVKVEQEKPPEIGRIELKTK